MGSKTGLLVLGMHRSATSAFTHLLCALGARPPSDLMPPSAENPDGYWESTALMAFHGELLREAGTAWDDLRAIAPAWYASHDAGRFKEAMLRFLGTQFDAATPLFVIKDPRICRFAGLWIEVLASFGATPRAVIPLRNPLEVAASLGARDGLPFAGSTLLWLRHVLDAERDTRAVTRSFAGYDELLEDWRRVAGRLGDQLDLRWPRWPEAEIDAFLSPEHKHQRAAAGELEARGDVLPWVRPAYDALMRLRGEPDHRASLEALDEIRADAQGAMRAYPLLHARHGAEVHALEAELEARSRELAALSERVTATEARAEQLSERLMAIHASRSWKLTRPLRSLARLVGGPSRLNGGRREQDP